MTLQFDAATHTYTLDGVILPSMTEVLAAAGLKPQSYKEVGEAVLAHAANRATILHSLIEADLTGKDRPSYPGEWQGYVDAWEEFAKATKIDPHQTEHQSYLPAYRVAGTLDCKGTLNYKGDRVKGIIDWKFTSKYHPCSHGPQVAGYHQMDLHWNPDDAASHGFVVVFTSRGGYSINRVDLPVDWRIAQAAIAIYWHKRKYGEIHGKTQKTT